MKLKAFYCRDLFGRIHKVNTHKQGDIIAPSLKPSDIFQTPEEMMERIEERERFWDVFESALEEVRTTFTKPQEWVYILIFEERLTIAQAARLLNKDQKTIREHLLGKTITTNGRRIRHGGIRAKILKSKSIKKILSV